MLLLVQVEGGPPRRADCASTPGQIAPSGGVHAEARELLG